MRLPPCGGWKPPLIQTTTCIDNVSKILIDHRVLGGCLLQKCDSHKKSDHITFVLALLWVLSVQKNFTFIKMWCRIVKKALGGLRPTTKYQTPRCRGPPAPQQIPKVPPVVFGLVQAVGGCSGLFGEMGAAGFRSYGWTTRLGLIPARSHAVEFHNSLIWLGRDFAIHTPNN